MCWFSGAHREREPIKRTEVEVTVGKLDNGKAEDKDEVSGKMIKDGGEKLVD